MRNYKDGYKTKEDYIEARRLVWRAQRAQLLVALAGTVVIIAWWVLQ